MGLLGLGHRHTQHIYAVPSVPGPICIRSAPRRLIQRIYYTTECAASQPERSRVDLAIFSDSLSLSQVPGASPSSPHDHIRPEHLQPGPRLFSIYLSGPDERAAHAEWLEAVEPTRLEARHVRLGLRRVVDG